MSETVGDRLRLFLSRWAFSPLQGATLGTWLRALRENRFRVSPAFWPRALLTTLSAAANSVTARSEGRRFGAAIREARPEPPVFILGHYRSGTTHLHNLLGADPRFAYVNNYQANFPRTFLVSESTGVRLGSRFIMRKRPHDNVRLDLHVPTEDELALCADTLLSPHMAWHFPHAAERYDRYLSFEEAAAAERAAWIASLRRLAAKLTVRYGRPIVFKSPLHTARVALLLEAFPEARFVTVHRHPYEIFRSTRNMERKVEPLFRYQWGDPSTLDERILRRYSAMIDRYFRDRERIAPGRLVEIAYDDLETDPIATLERVYARIDLPDFEQARPHVERYLTSLGTYEKNAYAPLPDAVRERIAREWQRSFQEWGYAP